jgi:hypothetical protein
MSASRAQLAGWLSLIWATADDGVACAGKAHEPGGIRRQLAGYFLDHEDSRTRRRCDRCDASGHMTAADSPGSAYTPSCSSKPACRPMRA